MAEALVVLKRRIIPVRNWKESDALVVLDPCSAVLHEGHRHETFMLRRADPPEY